MTFHPVLSTHTNPMPRGFSSQLTALHNSGSAVSQDKHRHPPEYACVPTPSGALASGGLLGALQGAVDAAQASYDATRSHKALTRLQDAKHALLAAEVDHGV